MRQSENMATQSTCTEVTSSGSLSRSGDSSALAATYTAHRIPGPTLRAETPATPLSAVKPADGLSASAPDAATPGLAPKAIAVTAAAAAGNSPTKKRSRNQPFYTSPLTTTQVTSPALSPSSSFSSPPPALLVSRAWRLMDEANKENHVPRTSRVVSSARGGGGSSGVSRRREGLCGGTAAMVAGLSAVANMQTPRAEHSGAPPAQKRRLLSSLQSSPFRRCCAPSTLSSREPLRTLWTSEGNAYGPLPAWLGGAGGAVAGNLRAMR